MSVEKDERMEEVEKVLKEQIKDHERLMQTHRFVILYRIFCDVLLKLLSFYKNNESKWVVTLYETLL